MVKTLQDFAIHVGKSGGVADAGAGTHKLSNQPAHVFTGCLQGARASVASGYVTEINSSPGAAPLPGKRIAR